LSAAPLSAYAPTGPPAAATQAAGAARRSRRARRRGSRAAATPATRPLGRGLIVRRPASSLAAPSAATTPSTPPPAPARPSTTVDEALASPVRPARRAARAAPAAFFPFGRGRPPPLPPPPLPPGWSALSQGRLAQGKGAWPGRGQVCSPAHTPGLSKDSSGLPADGRCCLLPILVAVETSSHAPVSPAPLWRSLAAHPRQ
jgi:hypothetical protein